MLDSQCQPASLSQHLKRGNSWCALLCHFPTLLPQGYHSRHRQSAAADKPDDRQEPGAAADGDAWPSDEVLSQRVRHLFTLLAQAVVLAESQGLLMPLPGEGLALSERLLQLPPSAGDLVVNPTSSSGSCCCLLLTFWVMRGARCSICVCVCALCMNDAHRTLPAPPAHSAHTTANSSHPCHPYPLPLPPPNTLSPHTHPHTHKHTQKATSRPARPSSPTTCGRTTRTGPWRSCWQRTKPRTGRTPTRPTTRQHTGAGGAGAGAGAGGAGVGAGAPRRRYGWLQRRRRLARRWW